MIAQQWLGLLMCIIWSIGVRLIRKLGRKKNQQIDDELDSSSDYTVFLEKLPLGSYNERDVLEYMERL